MISSMQSPEISYSYTYIYIVIVVHTLIVCYLNIGNAKYIILLQPNSLEYIVQFHCRAATVNLNESIASL